MLAYNEVTLQQSLQTTLLWSTLFLEINRSMERQPVRLLPLSGFSQRALRPGVFTSRRDAKRNPKQTKTITSFTCKHKEIYGFSSQAIGDRVRTQGNAWFQFSSDPGPREKKGSTKASAGNELGLCETISKRMVSALTRQGTTRKHKKTNVFISQAIGVYAKTQGTLWIQLSSDAFWPLYWEFLVGKGAVYKKSCDLESRIAKTYTLGNCEPRYSTLKAIVLYFGDLANPW